MGPGLNFESVVASNYEPLYQFAFGLPRAEADACDLTQQTFYVWATKGHQLRDQTKVKTWLFTTLHRAFLESRRRQVRFPHYELDEVPLDLPTLSPASVNELDSPQVLEALSQIDEIYHAPVTLYFLEDCPYIEIAEILNIPIGTVKSRMARGIAQLQTILSRGDRESHQRKNDYRSGKTDFAIVPPRHCGRRRSRFCRSPRCLRARRRVESMVRASLRALHCHPLKKKKNPR